MNFLSSGILNILNFYPCNGNLSSAENLCKQFGPKSGLIECLSWSGSKPFDTLIVFLKEYFEKVILKKVGRRQQSMKNYQACEKSKWVSTIKEVLWRYKNAVNPLYNISVCPQQHMAITWIYCVSVVWLPNKSTFMHTWRDIKKL